MYETKRHMLGLHSSLSQPTGGFAPYPCPPTGRQDQSLFGGCRVAPACPCDGRSPFQILFEAPMRADFYRARRRRPAGGGTVSEGVITIKVLP